MSLPASVVAARDDSTDIVPSPPVTYAHASTVNEAGFRAASYGTWTCSEVPLNPTEVFALPASAPAAPSVGVST